MSSLQLTASIISQLAALLQIKYQTENPFTTLPTTMFFAVSSLMICYIIQISLLRFPMSRFADAAKHILVWVAYVAVSTLAAALYPDKARPFIYASFALLSFGDMLYVFRHQLAVEDEAEGEALRFLKKTWYGVAKFFGHQPQPMLPL